MFLQRMSGKLGTKILFPSMYCNDIISLAHETTMAGHLEVTKTHDRTIQHFYWPKMKQDVLQFCKTCRTCQIVGKPNTAWVPLKPIPVFDEPFSWILIDCVGSLPKTKSGNEYSLTIVCVSTRFPEAIPLQKINARNIIKELTKFFTRLGLPKTKGLTSCLGYFSKLCTS